MYQPMGMGFIATFKLHYRSLLLNRILGTRGNRAEIRRASRHFKARLRGLDEVYDPHVLEVTEMVQSARENITARTVACCWIKARILYTDVHDCLIMEHVKHRARDKVKPRRAEVNEIADILRNLQFIAPVGNDIAEELDGVQSGDVKRRFEVGEDGEVQKALLNDALQSTDEVHTNASEIYLSADNRQKISASEDEM